MRSSCFYSGVRTTVSIPPSSFPLPPQPPSPTTVLLKSRTLWQGAVIVYSKREEQQRFLYASQSLLLNASIARQATAIFWSGLIMVGQILAFLYTIFIIVVAIHSIFNAKCPPACLHEVPQVMDFTDECVCLNWNLNCQTEGLNTTEKVEEYIIQIIPESIRMLTFEQCPITDIPVGMYPRFKWLYFLEFYDTQLVNFTYIPHVHFPSLYGLSVIKSPMKVVPPNLMDHHMIHEFRLQETAISRIPLLNNLIILAERVFYDDNKFTTIPHMRHPGGVELQPVNIKVISMSGNPIKKFEAKDINKATEWLFGVGWNITTLSEPNMMTVLPKLKHIHLANGQLQTILSELQVDMMSSLTYLDLSGNPICDDPLLREGLVDSFFTFACHNSVDMCHSDCLDAYERGNSHCDRACNHVDCGFDDGDCTSLINNDINLVEIKDL